MATKKRKPTPAQLAARQRFAEMARSGAFKKGAKRRRTNPTKKTVSQKISQLTREGYPQKQAVAIALNEERAGKVKRNPVRYRNEAKEFKKDDPAWIGYSVHRPTQPGSAYAILNTKAEAVEYAQELADRKKTPFAVTRIRYKVAQD